MTPKQIRQWRRNWIRENHEPAGPQCVHLGEPLSPEQAGRLSLGTVRAWRPCAKGHGEPGKPAGYVACCRADSVCGPKCNDFQGSK